MRSHLVDPTEPMPWALIRLALSSTARLSVVPAQDLLGLGSESRMNTPGTDTGNWDWQASAGVFDAALAARLRALVAEAGQASGLSQPDGDSYSRTRRFGAVSRQASSTSSRASSSSIRSSRARTQPKRPEVYHSEKTSGWLATRAARSASVDFTNRSRPSLET